MQLELELELTKGMRDDSALCGVYGVWLTMVDRRDLCGAGSWLLQPMPESA